MSHMTETKRSARKHRASSIQNGNASATASLLKAADALHSELLSQIEALMNCRAGSKRAADLERIATVVEHYEQKRWPII